MHIKWINSGEKNTARSSWCAEDRENVKKRRERKRQMKEKKKFIYKYVKVPKASRRHQRTHRRSRDEKSSGPKNLILTRQRIKGRKILWEKQLNNLPLGREGSFFSLLALNTTSRLPSQRRMARFDCKWILRQSHWGLQFVRQGWFVSTKSRKIQRWVRTNTYNGKEVQHALDELQLAFLVSQSSNQTSSNLNCHVEEGNWRFLDVIVWSL